MISYLRLATGVVDPIDGTFDLLVIRISGLTPCSKELEFFSDCKPVGPGVSGGVAFERKILRSPIFAH